MYSYDKSKIIRRIQKLEEHLFIELSRSTVAELDKRHEDGVLLHYLRALEKLKVEQE